MVSMTFCHYSLFDIAGYYGYGYKLESFIRKSRIKDMVTEAKLECDVIYRFFEMAHT